MRDPETTDSDRDAVYFISEILERAGLEDVVDGPQGIELGFAIAQLLAKGWFVQAPARLQREA